MLDRAGNVHVADFGIASAAGLDSLTVTGTVLGTAGYLSPEQAIGNRAAPPSDRYGLAVVAYELLTGKRPYEADSPTAEASAHVNAPVPSVCDMSDLPCELDPVFRKALAKEPADRFDSCAEFVAALRAAMADAAGATRELPPVAAAPMPVPTERPPAEPPPPAPWARPPRRRGSAWPLLAVLLLAAAAGGALAAYFLTRDDGGSATTPTAAAPPQPRVTTVTRTVTQATGQTTTVVQQVTTTPPATTTPAPAASPAAGGNGHSLNDSGYRRMQAGDYAGAVPLLQQAVRALNGTGPRDPYEAYANYNLGYSLLKLNRCGEAIPYLQKADRLEPWRHEPRDALAQAQACA
jgi:hypothetical protein